MSAIDLIGLIVICVAAWLLYGRLERRQRALEAAAQQEQIAKRYTVGVDPAAPDGDYTGMTLCEGDKVVATVTDGKVTYVSDDIGELALYTLKRFKVSWPDQSGDDLNNG